MMRLFGLYVALVGAGVLIGISGNETLAVAGIFGALALVVGMFVVAWPVRPPQNGEVGYRKDDMDWPMEEVLEVEWTLVEEARGLYLAAPQDGGVQ